MPSYNIICVDDEIESVNFVEKLCRQQNPDNTVKSFSSPLKALEYAKNNNIEIALLDIDMAETDGLTLAKEIKKLHPNVNIIMTTAYTHYALDSLNLDCSGYLLKPITLSAINHQFSILRYPKKEKQNEKKFKFNCFGNFEAFYNNEPIVFTHNKTLELLAYLIDRKGALCSNGQITATLWEDFADHTSYLKIIKRDLANTFEKLSADPVISTARGFICIQPSLITCDYFDYLNNKNDSFAGEYMEQYSWAEITKSNLFYKMTKE